MQSSCTLLVHPNLQLNTDTSPLFLSLDKEMQFGKEVGVPFLPYLWWTLIPGVHRDVTVLLPLQRRECFQTQRGQIAPPETLPHPSYKTTQRLALEVFVDDMTFFSQGRLLRFPVTKMGIITEG